MIIITRSKSDDFLIVWYITIIITIMKITNLTSCGRNYFGCRLRCVCSRCFCPGLYLVMIRLKICFCICFCPGLYFVIIQLKICFCICFCQGLYFVIIHLKICFCICFCACLYIFRHNSFIFFVFVLPRFVFYHYSFKNL